MNNYLPKEDRKKVLLIADDPRLHSGVGTMALQIILKTAQHFNWIALGAAVQHPEQGKIIDISQAVNEEIKISDASVRIIPFSGYGDENVIRQLLTMERPDAIMLFTDPRYFYHLFMMEAEIRKLCPLIYYNIWDNLPYPTYNKPYYESCDALLAISRQTHNINKVVLGENSIATKLSTDSLDMFEKPYCSYLPHGVDHNTFYKLSTEEELKKVADLRKRLYGEDDVDFVLLYDNRNIRRKAAPNLILGFREFLLKLPKEKADKCRLLFHTPPIDDNGTNLLAVLKECAPEIKYVFYSDVVPPPELNVLYNSVDGVVNVANAEGWGLSETIALMTERMSIANVTGGLQDQMGFKNDEGKYLSVEDYTEDWGSNHDGKYKTSGEWIIPIFPNNFELIGSPPTPFIFNDQIDYRELGDKILELYNIPSEERDRRGKLGREFALEQGFTAEIMGQRFIDELELLFKNWKAPKRY